MYALLETPTTQDEAAYLSVYWQFKDFNVNIEYSCSIEWFNDVRSDVTVNTKKFKVMLLGANHTF